MELKKINLPIIITNLEALKVKKMSKLSKHFSRVEFACRCGCGFDTVDVELLEVLTTIRCAFNSPVTITSPCRCEKHNVNIGGSYGSKHKRGIAADIVVKGVTPDEVYKYLDDTYPTSYGIGKYESFTHIDVRHKKARWKG